MTTLDPTLPLRIRPLASADYPHWLPLWDGYLYARQRSLNEAITLLTFERLCIGERLAGLVAEAPDGTLLGLAHLAFHPSTWSEQGCGYLEDLYVSEAARRRGIARQLVEAACQLADEKPCHCLYWTTDETNTAARALYDQLGERTSLLTYRRW
ncbi:GNAT family N-acetyltransferase [Nissabacter sp. SGAir0207]|uniref:GNAT family N-acetyltransferase n=1 Tax=Nissabacter sp. SGAir0207 TaxID=2126321 RepID=UPI0010CD34B1|nr:GNAT family N-acetyltransferase [Nissabacter sp. SGAir0207]QCR35594.1 GNAT family N-acetyltransferase [Nissabacter sp. SGAir0207]